MKPKPNGPSVLERWREKVKDTIEYYGSDLSDDNLAFFKQHLTLLDALEIAEKALEFYGDVSKYFQKEHVTNLQETTAVFKVEDPAKLPTEFKSKSWEVTARLKIDHGTKAREARERMKKILEGKKEKYGSR